MQDDIDYLAENIAIRYNVLDNFDSASTFSGEMFLENTGERTIQDIPWTLYYCDIRTMEPQDIDPDGAELGDSGLKVFRVNGCLYKIEPQDEFLGFQPGEVLHIEFVASSFKIARTDSFPNWYFVGPDTDPRVVVSTAVEDLSFIDDFNVPEQWKRSPGDQYDPYSPEDRLDVFDIEDLGEAPGLIVPTPVFSDLDPDSVLDFTGPEWVVVVEDEAVRSEASYLAGM